MTKDGAICCSSACCSSIHCGPYPRSTKQLYQTCMRTAQCLGTVVCQLHRHICAIRSLKDNVISWTHICQKSLFKGCMALIEPIGVEPTAAIPYMRQYGPEVILGWIRWIYDLAAAISYLHILLYRRLNDFGVQIYTSRAALSILCLQVLTHLLQCIWRHVSWIFYQAYNQLLCCYTGDQLCSEK